MAAIEYKIKIQHELIADKNNIFLANDSSPDQQMQKAKETGASSSSVAKVIATQMGKKALQYATSNYGNLTGDYITQESINSAIEMSFIISFLVWIVS